MLTIVYPYIERLQLWNELRYSLRSLEWLRVDASSREFQVMIIGNKPEWVKNVIHVPHTRVDSVEYTNCYDAVRKLTAALQHPGCTEDVMLMYDDIYILQSVNPDFFANPIAMQEMRYYPADTTHHRLMNRTFDELQTRGLPYYNYETHLPRIYKREKMLEVIEKFNPQDNRLLTNTLYYNYWFKDQRPQLIEYNHKIKSGFYDEDYVPYSYPCETREQVLQAMSGRLVLNHNDEGLSPVLKEVIEQLFSEKCEFEK